MLLGQPGPGGRAEQLGHLPARSRADPHVHAGAQQEQRRDGQGGPPQPGRSRLRLQAGVDRPEHLPAQLGPDAAGRQAAEQLFHVFVHGSCLPNQACIFARAER